MGPAVPVVRNVLANITLLLDLQEPKGDILVFLTGREEIEEAAQEIADRAITYVPSASSSRLASLTHDLHVGYSMPKAAPRLLPIPLHGGLSPEEQQAMFAPPPRDTRKVVVATNIAEASVTIEGIKYVIDSGFVKVCAME